MQQNGNKEVPLCLAIVVQEAVVEVDVFSEHLSFLLQRNILLKHNKDPQQSPMKVASVFCVF